MCRAKDTSLKPAFLLNRKEYNVAFGMPVPSRWTSLNMDYPFFEAIGSKLAGSFLQRRQRHSLIFSRKTTYPPLKIVAPPAINVTAVIAPPIHIIITEVMAPAPPFYLTSLKIPVSLKSSSL